MHLGSSQSPATIPPYPNFACGYSFKRTSKMGDDGRYGRVNSIPVAKKKKLNAQRKVEQESSNSQDPIPPAL